MPGGAQIMRKGTGVKKFLIKHPKLYKASLGLVERKNILLITPAIIAQLTQEWAKKSLPNNFDLYIGVPRAGMPIAWTLSLLYCRPYATPDSFQRGEYYFTSKLPMPPIKKVLICEELVKSARKAIEVKEILSKNYPDVTFEIGSLHVTEDGKMVVDHYYKVAQDLEHFHDNMIDVGGDLSVDFDGVLCKNPPAAAVENMSAYRLWVTNAVPHFIPKCEIKSIITGRPESVRLESEQWLKEHGVKYKKMFMLTKEEQCSGQAESIAHKVKHIKESKPKYFWESDYLQAKEINRLTGVPVYCIDEMQIFGNYCIDGVI
jgi:orotate phosphoribosyltransferase